MCAAIVGKGAGIVHLADGDVLHRARREEVEWNQFVVRVRRGDGQSVQRGAAVAVAQSANDELARFGNGDTGQFLNSFPFLHVADTFDAHFLGTQVLDGQCGFLSFYLQGAFAFQVLLGYYRYFAQCLRIGFHFEVQYGFSAHLYLAGVDVHIAYVAYYEVVRAVGHTERVVAVNVGYGSRRTAGYLYGGSGQRFFSLFVSNCSLDSACQGSHGR